MLCLYVMKRLQHYNLAFTYRDMGHAFHEYILRRLDAFHAVLCLYCCVTDNT